MLINGYLRLLLVIKDFFCQVEAIYANYGYLGLPMATYGHLWLLLVIFQFLGICSYLWLFVIFMAIYGYL